MDLNILLKKTLQVLDYDGDNLNEQQIVSRTFFPLKVLTSCLGVLRRKGL